MELARKKIEESRLQGASYARQPVPVARFDHENDAQVQDTSAVNGQAGRLQVGHKAKHLDGGSDFRNFDRYENRASRRRSKKATRSRDRRVRSAETLRDTVLAQIRVASGETGASPALVANARKALQPRLDALRAEMPGLSDEEAFEGLRAALSVLR